MLAFKLLGIPIRDPTGKRIGVASDMLFDNMDYRLKYVVIAKIYIKALKLGFMRYIVPAYLLSFMNQLQNLTIVLGVLGEVLSNFRHTYLKDLNKTIKKRDIVALLLAIFTLTLFCLGVITSYAVYGQVILWIVVALLMFLPVLILEIQYIDVPGISIRYLYKKKILDVNGNLIGFAADIEFNLINNKITKVVMVPPLFHRIPEQLMDMYKVSNQIKLPIKLVKEFRKDCIVLKVKFDELRHVLFM